MAKIRILPEQLANRIAAGEVVERPASVVKELVENSLDAGADHITVEIEGGGTRLIRVLDNGSGMDEDDVLLCFERHGTSKIHESHDLVAIDTLGFRGEAIPSIASVSKMTITSRPEQSPLGTTVVFDYGHLLKVHETGCSQGTVIEVRNLFARTPARKKFLRTVRTEIGHIDEIIKSYALASPKTSFTLSMNGRETIRLTNGHDLEYRLRSIINYHDRFIPVGDSENTTGARRLHGFLLPPECTPAGSARLRLFINGRAIRDRLMSHAVFEGLRGFLLKGHAPAGYLHLSLPSEEIDVNVHPAKQEVRFLNSGDIHQFVKQSVETAMRQQQQRFRSAFFPAAKSLPAAGPAETAEEMGRDARNGNEAPPQSVVGVVSRDAHPQHQAKPRQSDIVTFAGVAPPVESREPVPAPSSAAPAEISPVMIPGMQKHGIRIIGRYKNLYIFCRAGDQLLVIDQHAAHERLVYEQLRKQYIGGKVAGQTLLFPETVELSPGQIRIVEHNQAEFERMGFSLTEFGDATYVISAIPALAGGHPAAEIFFDVLRSFGGTEDSRNHGGKLENILASMACKAAVRSGDKLSDEEIDALLEKMAGAEMFSHCPHGRPVFKSFSDAEIQKWFHRT
jgi:DNA mismatch repair protein MutL